MDSGFKEEPEPCEPCKPMQSPFRQVPPEWHQQHICMAAQLPECISTSAADVAAQDIAVIGSEAEVWESHTSVEEAGSAAAAPARLQPR